MRSFLTSYLWWESGSWKYMGNVVDLVFVGEVWKLEIGWKCARFDLVFVGQVWKLCGRDIWGYV